MIDRQIPAFRLVDSTGEIPLWDVLLDFRAWQYGNLFYLLSSPACLVLIDIAFPSGLDNLYLYLYIISYHTYANYLDHLAYLHTNPKLVWWA